MRDMLKAYTGKDYRAWDLDVKEYVHIYNRRKLEKIIKRKAKRKIDMELRKEIYA